MVDSKLHDAATMGNVDEIKALLEAKADVNVTNNNDETPLHYAAAWGRVDAIAALLKAGSDPNAKSSRNNDDGGKYEETPKQMAARCGKLAEYQSATGGCCTIQ